MAEELHVSVGDTLTGASLYGLLGFGLIAFVIQQLSLATGQLAPAVAAVCVCNTVISVILFEERLTRPGWHVLVATLALLASLAGAVIITLANRSAEQPGPP